ncbi:class I adenylate-forming enzyme family protein [Ruminococcus flavefaciens]|uniref:class I adenylate-forming enzyme family protein n=1 Tax=Ruminococcus flavefaciens TaxID=1265 RepID=UPI001565AFD5|nr:class I adenylate-forming enzyme family protein [Ruminococcus flavefaciens]
MKRHLEYPECSVYDLLEERSKEFPEFTALDYFGSKITYKKLIDKISKCAKALDAIGVKKGDSVSICLPNIPEAVCLFYAVNKIGAVANMIHPMSAENEIIRFIQLTESSLIFGIDLIGDKLSSVQKKCPQLNVITVSAARTMPFLLRLGYKLTQKKPPQCSGDSWDSFISGASNGQDISSHGKADETAAILYSGGTTGKPKGIMLTNMNFNALAIHSIDACGGLCPGMKMLSVMPIFHGFGLGVCIHTMLILGGTAVIQPKFSARDFPKLLFRYKPDIIAGVPAIYEAMLIDKSFDGKDLSFLKCIISGGDSLAPSTKKKLNKMLAEHGCKARVREGYGLTECVTGSCLMPADSEDLLSVGLPYADTFYKIIGENDQELPPGEIGQIILRGPSVMKGYYKEPDETAKTLRKREDGYTWLYTGDLGYMNEEGFVYFSQRLKRMIISGGYNIYPQNIEEVLSSHKDVIMCAVVGVPDQVMGEKVRACVVPSENCDEEKLRQDLNQLIEKNVARYAQPRELFFMRELPKTLVGKIAYNELKKEAVNEK